MIRDAPLRIAIDLGAGSGRAMVGRIHSAGLGLEESHRFHYEPRFVAGRLRWDFGALTAGIKEGIRKSLLIAPRLGGEIKSIGVDSWGVDYGLLDSGGRLLEEPVCYRDVRTEGVMAEVCALLGREEIFARTGIQFLPFNTLYQLVAHLRGGLPAEAARLLMIPDLCHHLLCGSVSGEHTNATTTQLLSASDGRWDETLFRGVGLPLSLMPDLVEAGTTLGVLRPVLRAELGAPALRVIAPATHDTGSAILGTPLKPGWAYISSGTWSLVGVERPAPLINPAVAAANFTNEGGAFGTVRLLKNVMGLWLLERCRREWEEAGTTQAHDTLIAQVERVEGLTGLIFPDDPRFFNPSSMTDEIQHALIETGQKAPDNPVLLAKVILDSLALRYASVLDTIETLTGETVPGVQIVGGGSRNSYLNQATANASARPVLAGPVEATALGNVLAQAIGCGEVGSLAEGRQWIARGVSVTSFEPREREMWTEAADRFRAYFL